MLINYSNIKQFLAFTVYVHKYQTANEKAFFFPLAVSFGLLICSHMLLFTSVALVSVIAQRALFWKTMVLFSTYLWLLSFKMMFFSSPMHNSSLFAQFLAHGKHPQNIFLNGLLLSCLLACPSLIRTSPSMASVF